VRHSGPVILAGLAASWVCSALIHVVNAAEVYKWTDANGQVHFGDRESAPSDSQKLDIKSQPGPEQRTPQSQPQSGKPPQPQGTSTPADPSQVPPGCHDLVGQIAKVKPGSNWQSLYQKFNADCPGIAYVCNNYRTHPENNKCEWVKRTGNSVMQTNNYE
jgi:hypothetical protein